MVLFVLLVFACLVGYRNEINPCYDHPVDLTYVRVRLFESLLSESNCKQQSVTMETARCLG